LNRSDLVALLRGGVSERGGRWADLGAGEGAFTYALAELLGPDARITAVDRDARAVRGLKGDFDVLVADFTKPFPIHGEIPAEGGGRGWDLRDLDGVVMANSLHFVRDKQPVLESVLRMLRPGGRLIVVEYAADHGNVWVPHPFTYQAWEKLAARAGFTETRFLHSVPSRWLGAIYSALSIAP